MGEPEHKSLHPGAENFALKTLIEKNRTTDNTFVHEDHLRTSKFNTSSLRSVITDSNYNIRLRYSGVTVPISLSGNRRALIFLINLNE